MTAKDQESRFDKARAVFLKHGGILRTANAIRSGIHPDTLYRMRDSGVLEVISRGVYRLADSPPLGNPDLVAVAMRVSGGVICLISALAFHGLTTQIPHEVHLALPPGAGEPCIDYPPIKTYRFAEKPYLAGVQIHACDEVNIRIYGPEKTIADCFKFRNKIGLDTAIEAIRFYRDRKRIRINELMRYAAICRIKKIIQPYLEALL